MTPVEQRIQELDEIGVITREALRRLRLLDPPLRTRAMAITKLEESLLWQREEREAMALLK